jgi:cyclic beta-1,2-glucan glucanotransferase
MLQLVILEEIAAWIRRVDHSVSNDLASESGHAAPEILLSRFVITLREIADADWEQLTEAASETDKILRQDPTGSYAGMDYESRNLYRGAVQRLASHSNDGELEIARKAIACARSARDKWGLESRAARRRSHLGYYLVDKGRPLLERRIGYRPPLPAQIRRVIQQGAGPEIFYLVGIELVMFAIAGFVLSGLRADVPLFWTLLLLFIPATESAIGVMNQLVSFLLPPCALPKMDFSQGIPDDCATVVAVPTLLISESQVRQMVRDLEIRYLGNRDANLHFALITDSPDSPKASDDQDVLVDLCSALVKTLNERYPAQSGGRFFHLHRHRTYNPSEGTWMGWERKRGKLLDFNNLLRGGFDSFPIKVGDLSLLSKVRYVITLDADTQLPRESAHRLVGAMAHPLNCAVIDPSTNTVVEGYGILQPRVGISVRSANRSRLAHIYSGQTGFDIYTRAVSNVYQDLCGEGSFTGKGIYEVDVFQRVLSKRFPVNAILSHDLIEGAYARAGLVSDIEVIDDYPSHFRAYSRRKHRWVRGDWQIMRWLLPRVPDYSGQSGPNPINVMSRWKILDNLRRSLVESATFALLLAGWFFLPGGAARWTVAVLVLLLIPSYLRLLLSLIKAFQTESLAAQLAEVAAGFVADQLSVFMFLAFLAHQTLVTLDAIVRTVVRLTITHRRLLQWETAAQSESEAQKATAVDAYLKWTPVVSLLLAVALAIVRPEALPAASPFLVLWALSGVLSQWLNRPLRPGEARISEEDRDLLRLTGITTWRFFRAFSNAETNWVIPDNFQEEPKWVAPRLSPTNLGLLLNARLAAWEMGYLTLPEFVGETANSLATAFRLSRCKGHFLNWYDIRTLQPVEPLFISTVDSGNLACCLWTLKQGSLQMLQQPFLASSVWQGLKEHVRIVVELANGASAGPQVVYAKDKLEAWIDHPRKDTAAWAADLVHLERILARLRDALAHTAEPSHNDLSWWARETSLRVESLTEMISNLTPWLLPQHRLVLDFPEMGISGDASLLTPGNLPGLLRTLASKLKVSCERGNASREALASAQSLRGLIPAALREADCLCMKLEGIATQADTLVRDMDFAFLYNHKRKVLSIGYDVAKQHLESACYELLASEARIAAFVAVAKGDVPQESWFHLGRAHTRCKGMRLLFSWSGTLFEYLMPALWMRTFPQTALDRTLRSAVACQRLTAKPTHMPWGISESACGERDDEDHYRYRAFGLPALALQPEPFTRHVIAPYASILALGVDAAATLKNLRTMRAMGWLGAYGFYEAADFSRSRADKPSDYELVHCWMVHHQGMILLAVCNALNDSVMQRLFHAEPMVAATERVLHERVPRAIPIEPSEEASNFA